MRDVEIWLLKLFVLQVLIILIFVGCLEESVRVAIERSVLVGTAWRGVWNGIYSAFHG